MFLVTTLILWTIPCMYMIHFGHFYSVPTDLFFLMSSHPLSCILLLLIRVGVIYWHVDNLPFISYPDEEMTPHTHNHKLLIQLFRDGRGLVSPLPYL